MKAQMFGEDNTRNNIDTIYVAGQHIRLAFARYQIPEHWPKHSLLVASLQIKYCLAIKWSWCLNLRLRSHNLRHECDRVMDIHSDPQIKNMTPSPSLTSLRVNVTNNRDKLTNYPTEVTGEQTLLGCVRVEGRVTVLERVFASRQ